MDVGSPRDDGDHAALCTQGAFAMVSRPATEGGTALHGKAEAMEDKTQLLSLKWAVEGCGLRLIRLRVRVAYVN